MKRKLKVVAAVVLSALMAVALVACGGGSSSSSGSSSTKTYVIATDTTFAPFEFQNSSGEYEGIDLALLDAIAKDQGFQYELQPVGFDAALQAVQSDQADAVIAGMSITDKRKETFDFSDPYFDSGVSMGVAASSSIASYSDLKGKNVAVKKGTEGQTFAESIASQYGFTTTVFQDSATMYQDVLAGNSVACFEDYPVLGYAINQGIGLKMVGDMEQGSSYGFAVKKGNNPELIEMFNAGLTDIKANGTYQEIMDKYISK